MIVTIHQPEHLPWLGFFHKVDQADRLVILDTFQYRKNYFQNRNRILGPAGPQWLTVPVLVKGHTSGRIREIAINNATEWRAKHWRTISQCYGRHPFFAEHAPFLEDLYARPWRMLADLNEHIIRHFIRALGITTEVLRASDLDVHGARSELLLDICSKTGADTYLAGQTGREYLDERIFDQAGVRVAYHAFSHPVYPQRSSEGFVSHLSTLDLLLNRGPASLDVIRSAQAAPVASA